MRVDGEVSRGLGEFSYKPGLRDKYSSMVRGETRRPWNYWTACEEKQHSRNNPRKDPTLFNVMAYYSEVTYGHRLIMHVKHALPYLPVSASDTTTDDDSQAEILLHCWLSPVTHTVKVILVAHTLAGQHVPSNVFLANHFGFRTLTLWCMGGKYVGLCAWLCTEARWEWESLTLLNPHTA